MSNHRGAKYEVSIVRNTSGKFSAECAYTIDGLEAIPDHHSHDICNVDGALQYFDTEEEARRSAEGFVQRVMTS